MALGAAVAGAYASVVWYAFAKAIDRLTGFRGSAGHDTTGVDFSQNAETAYAN